MYDLKPGDVIGFSGRTLASDGINLATFGIPRWGISHVGIMSEPWVGYTRLYESKSGYVVGHSELLRTVQDYAGRVWVFPLARPLFTHETTRLRERLEQLSYRDYDTRGALQSGGRLWSWVNAAFRGEDLTSLFCSELVAEVLSHIGAFQTSNASRWNPNHLVRTLVRRGIVSKPRRLK